MDLEPAEQEQQELVELVEPAELVVQGLQEVCPVLVLKLIHSACHLR